MPVERGREARTEAGPDLSPERGQEVSAERWSRAGGGAPGKAGMPTRCLGFAGLPGGFLVPRECLRGKTGRPRQKLLVV